MKVLYYDSTIHFGKYKGEILSKAIAKDPSYFKWLTSNTDWEIKYKKNPKELPEKTDTLYQNTILHFGKYKGTEVKDVPFHYQKWIIDNTNYSISREENTEDLELTHTFIKGKYKGLTLAEIIRCVPEKVKLKVNKGQLKLSKQAKYTLYNNPKKALKVLQAYYPTGKIEGDTIDKFLDNYCKLSDWSRIKKTAVPNNNDFD